MSKSNLFLTENDVDLLDEHIEDIKEQAELVRSQMFKPPIEVRRKIIDGILNFIKERKRKIYGGYALNELLQMADKNVYIYEEGTVNDVDFYSPDPINDVIDLSDQLHALKLGDVRAREAVHGETYSIFVDDENYCDISYVPKNIYNRMPFKTTNDGLLLIHPHFMWIDYLRMLTDPINSWFRIEKCYRRFLLLQKHYKFPQNLSGIDVGKSNSDLDTALFTILTFLKDRTSTITVGFYAYNCFLEESGAIKGVSRPKKQQNSKTRQRTSDVTLKFLDVPYYEIISTNYKEDALELIEKLKEAFPDDKDAIKQVEYYPFFQFTGFSVDIYCKGEMVAKIHTNYKRCLPYQDIKCKYYNSNKSDHYDMGGKIRIGTFSLTLLYNLVNVQRHRTNNKEELKELFYVIASHLIHMRNYYFDKTGKNILDNTLFREMVISCIGKTITPFAEKRMRIEKRKKENVRYTFSYNPSVTLAKRPKLIFTNSSGNEITNPKNLKLTPHEEPEDNTQIEADDVQLSTSDDQISDTE